MVSGTSSLRTIVPLNILERMAKRRFQRRWYDGAGLSLLRLSDFLTIANILNNPLHFDTNKIRGKENRKGGWMIRGCTPLSHLCICLHKS